MKKRRARKTDKMTPMEKWRYQYSKYIKTRIREIFGWSPYKAESKKRAQISPTEFKCESCGRFPLTRKEIDCDHVMPVEKLDIVTDWNEYVVNALEHGGSEGLQWICKPCHKIKTKLENQSRRLIRKKK